MGPVQRLGPKDRIHHVKMESEIKAYRICNISHAHTPEEHRQTVIIPITTFTCSIFFLLLLSFLFSLLLLGFGVCGHCRHFIKLRFSLLYLHPHPQPFESPVNFWQHLGNNDTPWSVRDTMEDVGHLEGGQCQLVPLGDELAGLPCHKFLGCGSWMSKVRDERQKGGQNRPPEGYSSQQFSDGDQAPFPST